MPSGCGDGFDLGDLLSPPLSALELLYSGKSDTVSTNIESSSIVASTSSSWTVGHGDSARVAPGESAVTVVTLDALETGEDADV